MLPLTVLLIHQGASDGAYHEGPVWGWLAGAYVEAYYRVHGDAAGARAVLAPFEDHLRDAGLGTISEIFGGDPPHPPHGCIAQAWSVGEVLRLLREELWASGGGAPRPGSPARAARAPAI